MLGLGDEPLEIASSRPSASILVIPPSSPPNSDLKLGADLRADVARAHGEPEDLTEHLLDRRSRRRRSSWRSAPPSSAVGYVHPGVTLPAPIDLLHRGLTRNVGLLPRRDRRRDGAVRLRADARAFLRWRPGSPRVGSSSATSATCCSPTSTSTTPARQERSCASTRRSRCTCRRRRTASRRAEPPRGERPAALR